MIIDAHTHLFTDEVARDRNRYADDTNFGLLYGDPRSRIATESMLLQYLDSSGIDSAFVMGFPWESESFADDQNRHFAALKGTRAGQVYAFGTVPRRTDNIDAWISDLHAAGITGVGEIGFYEGGLDADAAAFMDAVLHAAGRHGMPVCLHVNDPVGHDYPGKYAPELDRLITIIANHPGLPIILAHWGGGLLFYEQMPEIASVLSSCCYDTAATPYLYRNSIYDIGVRLAGPDRILMGTDFPLLSLERYRPDIEASGLSRPEIDAVLGGNARALIGRVNGSESQ